MELVQTFKVHVAGLECAMCARKLERCLRSRHGVHSARVDRTTGMLHVRHRPEEITAMNLMVEVRRAGFVPGGMRCSVHVAGVHCAACARTIELALLRRPGIAFARLNLETDELVVDFEANQTSRAEIETSIERLGYGVMKEHEVKVENHNRRRRCHGAG